jgi:hypothetical protein
LRLLSMTAVDKSHEAYQHKEHESGKFERVLSHPMPPGTGF